MKSLMTVFGLVTISLTANATSVPAVQTLVDCTQSRYAAPGSVKRTVRVHGFVGKNSQKVAVATLEDSQAFQLTDGARVQDGGKDLLQLRSDDRLVLSMDITRSSKSIPSVVSIKNAEGNQDNELMTCKVLDQNEFAAHFPNTKEKLDVIKTITPEVYVLDPSKVSYEAVDLTGPVNEIQFVVEGKIMYTQRSGEMGPTRRKVNALNNVILEATQTQRLLLFHASGPETGRVTPTNFPVGTPTTEVLANLPQSK